MQEMFKNISEDEINLYILVLTASNISHLAFKEEGLWNISVNESDVEHAHNCINQYFKENADFSTTFDTDGVIYQKTYLALWICSILVAIHTFINKNEIKHIAVEKWGASASRILEGEIYRATTSLFLHSDQMHLTGNVIGIAIFGTYVWSTLGWGAGSFLILTSGILGNLLTAYLYQAAHVSIGASTAVFGAIGILSGQNLTEKTKNTVNKFRRLLPVGSGLALLGLFSAGEHTDLMAHLFGLICGIVGGTVYTRHFHSKSTQTRQFIFFILSLFIVLIAIVRSFLSQ